VKTTNPVRWSIVSEFAVMAIVKQLFDKLTTDAVQRILSYMETYMEQRIYHDEDMGGE
jgi:hypothetical protein